MSDARHLPELSIRLTDDLVQIGGFATRYLTDPNVVRDAYVLLEHTLAPGLIGAPPHRHAREDELSYVLTGQLTVWRAGVVTVAGPGTVVPKPRGEWHTFWNAGADPVRFLELVSPPGFAGYFRELGELLRASAAPEISAIVALAARYGLEFNFEALEPLMAAHALRLG